MIFLNSKTFGHQKQDIGTRIDIDQPTSAVVGGTVTVTNTNKTSMPGYSRKKMEGQKRVNSSQNETLSSCLMFMDDNHRLIEWIAYHFFALPLGHLVIAVDPKSETQPDIDGFWKDVITIEVWQDDD